MKVLIALLLLVAASATAWILATTSGPSYVAPSEPPLAYAPAPTVLITDPGPGEALREFDVEGMCCTGCTGKLKAALDDFPGVRAAAVSFESSSASVIADAKIPPADLAARLCFDKYTASPKPLP